MGRGKEIADRVRAEIESRCHTWCRKRTKGEEMKNIRITPGLASGEAIFIIGCDDNAIQCRTMTADIYGEQVFEYLTEVQRRLEAFPDMLAALEDLCPRWKTVDLNDPDMREITKIVRAIRKARETSQ